MMKRILSWILVLSCIVGIIPGGVLAREIPETAAAVQEAQIQKKADEISCGAADLPHDPIVYSIRALADLSASETDVPIPASNTPDSGSCGENVTWVLDGNGTLTISGSGPMANGAPWAASRQSIRSVVIQKGVTSIGSETFLSCPNLTNVQIADSVTHIGLRAFYNCDGLVRIQIPGSAAVIGDYAFAACDELAQVKLGAGVGTLGEGAFLQCGKLTDLELPEGLTTIEVCAFQGCASLPNLQIPSSVKTIETGAFSYCTAMTKMVIPDTVTTLGGDMFWKCENIREVVLPMGLQKIEDYFFSNCTRLEKVVFPENPTALGENVFVCCYTLTELDLPDSITSIGRGAFWYCDNLQKINLPAQLQSIEESAFTHCISLDAVHFPAKVSSIAASVFSMCESLQNITVAPDNACYRDVQGVLYDKNKTVLLAYPGGREGSYSIPEGVSEIGDYAFETCPVTRVEIPDSVTSIGKRAFTGCSELTALELPDNLASVGNYAFYGIGHVGTVEIPGGVSEIPLGLFESSGVEKIVAGEGITVIGRDAFSSCFELSKIVLPDTLTRIEGNALQYCNLTEIVIPRNVTYLGRHSFGGCFKLKRVFFLGDVPEFDDCSFSHYNGGPIGVKPMEATLCYQADNLTWTEAAIAQIDERNEGIAAFRCYVAFDEDDLAYGDCGAAAKWVLRKDGTMTIFPYDEDADGRYVHGIMSDFTGENAPWAGYQDQIQCVYIKDGIQNVSGYAFAGCANMTEVSIPNTASWIGEGAFQNCGNLAELTIPASVRQIGAGFVSGCTALEGITVASDNPCFSTDVEGVLYDKVFSRLMLVPAGITGTCYLSENLSVVDDYAFCLSTNLDEVVFAGNPPVMGDNAFYGTRMKVYYPADNPAWEDSVRKPYGGEITWIAYDRSLYFGADVQLYSKTKDLSLSIRPKDSIAQLGKTPIKRDLEDVTMYSILGEQLPEEGEVGFRIAQEQAAQQDIVLKCRHYQDYVIPQMVSASVAALAVHTGQESSTSYQLDAYMTKLKSDKPYVSTVFGRETNSGTAYLDLVSNEMKLEQGAYHDVIMTVVGAEGRSVQYVISQDENHKLSNDTGHFQYADLYRKLDYGKKVYAYAIIDNQITTDHVELCITKMQPPDQATLDFLKGSSIKLLGNGDLVIGIPEIFPLVGGGKINLDAFEFPIGVDVKGSTIRLTFGIDIFKRKQEFDDPSKDEGAWIDFKKKLSGVVNQTENKEKPGKLESAVKKMEIYRAFKEQYSDEYSAYYSQNKNFDIEFLGYAEAELVNGKLVFKEILLDFKGEFMFRYTQQGAVWVVPAYFYVEAGAEMDLTTTIGRFMADRAIPLELGAKLLLEPKLKLGGGAGVKGAASAGIWGKGSLPFLWDFTDQYILLKMKGDFGVEAEFFILQGDKSLLSGELTLFERFLGAAESMERMLRSCMEPFGGTQVRETASVHVVSREYAEKTSDWMGADMTRHAPQAGADFHTLQSGVFSRSQPQIAALGDGLIMVWVEDDPSRDEYNRMRLVYSVYDTLTGHWSEPQAVSDDGRNDAYPSMVSNGTDLYVCWQKINQTLTAEDCTGVDVLLKNSEIFLAQFDAETGRFLPATQLTDHERYEYSAVVTLDNEEPVVYYAGVAPEQINQPKAHTLYCYNTRERVKDRNLNYILSIAAEEDSLAYVMDADGDLGTTNDINVYEVNPFFTSGFGKGENDVAYSYAAFAQLNGNEVLFVSDMSNIYYRDSFSTQSVFDSARSISGSINLLSGENGPIFLWTETVGDADELFMACYDGNGWTKPVMVSSQNRKLRDVDAIIFDGKIAGACSCDTEDGLTALDVFELDAFTDLAVIDCISFDESDAVPGQECPFDVVVRNQGMTRIDEVRFTVTDGLGTAHTVTKSLALNPGELSCVTLSYPVPADYAATTLKVEAAVDADADLSNNSAEADIGKPDLTIRQEHIHVTDGGYVLSVSVENCGAAAAMDVVLDVRLEEDAADSVFTQPVGSLDRNTYAVIDVGIPTDQLIFDENGIARVYLGAESGSDDASDTDNRLCILICVPYEKQCTHSMMETIAGREADCWNSGYTACVQCASCGWKQTERKILPSLGHDLGDWTVSETADCEENGSKIRHCQRPGCGYSEAEILDAPGHNFFHGICTRCGAADNPFTDVPAGSFYYDPVIWAVANGVTTGATATTFNPNGSCMRAHVVTFLWRAAGQPEPASTVNPFVDVKPADFYYKAVLWAVEKGVTNGLDATHFGPFAYCNRAQVVTFLWRAMDQPGSSAAVSFTDVKPGQFYSTAVAWAVENGITNGMSATTFGVGSICNRAQVVTFLYRTFV